jgi:hypothetical protein
MFHVRPRHSLATKSVHFPARCREVTRNNDPFKDPFTIASRLWFDPFSVSLFCLLIIVVDRRIKAAQEPRAKKKTVFLLMNLRLLGR